MTTFITTLSSGINSIVNTVRARLRTARTAQQLRVLNDRQLADIGLTRDDIGEVAVHRAQWAMNAELSTPVSAQNENAPRRAA